MPSDGLRSHGLINTMHRAGLLCRDQSTQEKLYNPFLSMFMVLCSQEQETPGTASRRPTLQNATDVNTYSRPQTPTAARPSPASSRNSSLSSGTPPRRTSESVSLTSRKSRRSLGERLEAALRGPGTEGERRILVSASSG